MSDVEPRPPYPGAPTDPGKQGGLKDPNAKPRPDDNDAGHVDIETGEESHDDEGGMIGEG